MKLLAITTTLIITLVNCAGCGTNETLVEIPELTIDSRLQPMVDEYLQDCRNHKVKNCRLENTGIINMKLVTKLPEYVESPSTIGVCLTKLYAVSNRAIRQVLIKEWVCKNNSLFCKELVYHELGHCMFKLAHQTYGIMQPALPTSNLENSWPLEVEAYWELVKEQQ